MQVLSLHETYVKYLILNLLAPTTSKTVALQLRRLPWKNNNDRYATLIVKYMVKACYKGRFTAIPCIAKVCLKLRVHRPEVSVRFVDTLLENVQQGLEKPNFRDQQRMIGFVRCLGELFVKRLISSDVVFALLFSFVNFGHTISKQLKTESIRLVTESESELGEVQQGEGGEETQTETDTTTTKQVVVPVAAHSVHDPRVPSSIDSPSYVFRIKLICVLLERTSSKLIGEVLMNLKMFLPCFHRYLFTKPVIPADVEFAALDVLDLLDSQLRKVARGNQLRSFDRPANWLEAHEIVIRHENADLERKELQGGDLKEVEVNENENELVDDDNNDFEDENENENENDDSNDDYDDTMDDSDDSDNDSDNSGSCSDDDDDDDSNESDDDSSDSEFLELTEEEEAAAHAEQMRKLEEAAFERELRKLTMEALEKGKSAVAAVGGGKKMADNMIHAKNIVLHKTETENDDSNESDDDSSDSEFLELTEEEEAAAHAEQMRKLEEAAFERELRKLTMEALEKGKSAVAAVGGGKKMADNMIHAKNIVLHKTETEKGSAGGAGGATEKLVSLAGSNGVAFKLIKRGHKGRVESKQIVVPTNTSLAKTASKQDDEGLREKELLKARVMQYSRESESSSMQSGNVYMDTDKLKMNKNKKLNMSDIDKAFGSGDATPGRGGRGGQGGGGGRGVEGGRGRGGRGPSSRTLFQA